MQIEVKTLAQKEDSKHFQLRNMSKFTYHFDYELVVAFTSTTSPKKAWFFFKAGMNFEEQQYRSALIGSSMCNYVYKYNARDLVRIVARPTDKTPMNTE